MTQQDNTSRAYELADEWISIILSTDPSLVSPDKPPAARMNAGVLG